MVRHLAKCGGPLTGSGAGTGRTTMAGSYDQRMRGTPATAGTADGGVGRTGALGLAIALGSGVLFAVWGLPRLAGKDAGAADAAGTLAEVKPDEMAGALSTMDPSAADRAKLADRKACGTRLAWVSIVQAADQPAVRIRLRSGRYVSPLFTVGPQPVRIALPYPAPYATGHGTLGVFTVGGAAVVGLQPVWHVAASAGEVTRTVTWRPDAGCLGPDG